MIAELVTSSHELEVFLQEHGVGSELSSRTGDRGAGRTGLSVPARTLRLVVYDEALADRIRDLLGDRPGLTEKRMFGGLAFLIGGNMAVAASNEGGILVRVDPAVSGELLASTPAYPMEMRGRTMNGWLRVAPADVRTDEDLADWVERGAAYAGSLPPK